MASATRIGGLISLNLLLPVAIFIFATGFFPYKPLVPGLATFKPTALGDHTPHAPFNKLVFMVVDALRSDFVFGHGSGFTFTQELIRDGHAIPFTAHATAPTVTMPRLKAITTGSIPSFLDMILNLAESDKSSSLSHQDTWLTQMKAKPDSNLIMYGDDTWLKLFPNTFSRSDGTSSFFVSDFTEVDNNVTRHIPDELKNSDWNVMVMHYLGMDHIGHKSGSKSINMLPKQREMDGTVQQIYEAIDSNEHLQDTLLVLCGDHGMTDGGNHGGSAPGETSPALVFVSPKLRNKPHESTYECPTAPHHDFEFYDLVEQSDIAPTLAGLLGFPVPLNNLGVFIPEFLKLWSNGPDKAQLLLRNAMQMLEIAKATFPHPAFDDPSVVLDCGKTASTAEELVCVWRGVQQVSNASSGESMSDEGIVEAAFKFCQLAQQSLSSTASNYDLTRLYLGLAVTTVILVVCSVLSWSQLQLRKSSSGSFFVLSGISYAVMMLASSYVEEEHQFWYWITSAWLMLQMMSSSQKGHRIGIISNAAMLVLFRILRRWTQSGQKWQGSHDISLALRDNPLIFMWPLILLTFQTLFNDLTNITFKNAGLSITASRFCSAFLMINLLLFKIAYTAQQDPELLNLPHQITAIYHAYIYDYIPPWLASSAPSLADPTSIARLQFFSLALAWLFVSSRTLLRPQPQQTSTHPLLVTLLLTQSRPAQIPTFLVFLCMNHFRGHHHQSTTSTTMTQLLLGRASFFLLGGTNGVATIDLANAYNGITSYWPFFCGILCVLANWSGPFFWACAPRTGIRGIRDSRAEVRLGNGEKKLEKKSNEKGEEMLEAVDAWVHECTLLTWWMSLEVVGVMLACVIHRQHLFVWTVFSPKFLYMGAWVCIWHLGVNVLGAGIAAFVGY